jgi:hypothetical protein
MKKKSFVLFSLAAFAIMLLSVCNNNPTITNVAGNSAYAYVHLPQDVLPACTVSQDTFDTWFHTGKATENGLVTEANSVDFGHNNNCEFYQWSERMFLWITSQNRGSTESGGTVMESPLFYTVAPDSGKTLKLVKHVSGGLMSAVSSLEKNGPNRLPVFSDKNGRLFEVQFHKPGEKVLVKNQSGQMIELGPVEKSANGLAVLKDKKGKTIERPVFVSNLSNPENVVHAFATGKGEIFLDENGNMLKDVKQATSDALMSQTGSLVYYITMVNDMYAYFLSAAKNGYMSGTRFPTTASARDSILAYARKKGYGQAPDSNALAVEIKTSWIIADSLTDQSSFITMDAMIPTYDTSSKLVWIRNGQKKVKLALVGIHVVGSVAGHPEMIWATFEHASNVPNASYQYINNNNQVQTVAADTGKWLFAAANADPLKFNISHMKVDTTRGDTISAIEPYTISASNTRMTFPFGTAFKTRPNQEDTSSSASNTQVISINNAIRSMIPGKDVRKNYLFIGATWTYGGTPPNGKVYSIDSTHGSAIGTSLLANSTMETYFQTNWRTCFTCHSKKVNGLLPENLSHIYKKIRPLTAMQQEITEKK